MAAAENARSFSPGKVLNRWFPVRGLTLTAVLLCAAAAVGFAGLHTLNGKARVIVADTLPSLTYASQANADLSDAFNRLLLASMAGSPAEQDRYRRESALFSQQTEQALDNYQRAISSEEDRANFNVMAGRRRSYFETEEKVQALLDQHHRAEALALCQTGLLPAYREYMVSGEKVLAYNIRLGETRGQSLLHSCALGRYYVAGFSLALFVLGFIIGLFK